MAKSIILPNTTLIEEAPLKKSLVEDIIRKICNISLETFANKSPIEKDKLMIIIEKKLNKSALPLGAHGSKYVKLIMRGVKSKAFNNVPDAATKKPYDVKTDVARKFNINIMPNRMQITVGNLGDIGEKYIKKCFNWVQRQKVLDIIKKDLLNSFNNYAIKNAISQNIRDEIKNHVYLSTSNIDFIIKNKPDTYENKTNFDSTYIIKLNERSGNHRNNLVNLSNVKIIQDTPLKTKFIEDIVKKISNVTLKTFSNKNPQEKGNILIKIGEELNKSAFRLGAKGAKYVKIIMKGIQAKVNSAATIDEPYGLRKKVEGTKKTIKLQHGKKKTKKPKMKLKWNVYKDTDKKGSFPNKYIRECFNSKQHQAVIDVIRNNYLKSLVNNLIKNAISQETLNEIQKYVDLETGINEYTGNDKDIGTVRRKIEFNFTHMINRKKSYDDKSRIKKIILRTSNVAKSNPVVIDIGNNTDTIAEPICDSTLEEVCAKIKLVKTFKCLSDSKHINILKLCDGISDCLDSSDEKLCAQQATGAIHRANRLLNYIDTSISHDCYAHLVDRNMLYKQNKILGDVLKNQLSFLEKHSMEGSGTYSRRLYNVESSATRQTIKEAVEVVDSLTSALATSMCLNINRSGALYRASGDSNLENKHYYDELDFSQPALEICKCNGPNCLKACTARCGKICHDMFALSQLTCEAVSGEDFVPLDVLCDGKLDCYDEADEKDCSGDIRLAKFEATNMYNYILKDIEAKTMVTNHDSIRARLLNLHALVVKYEKISLTKSSDILEVKRIRISLFEELMKVYDNSARYIKEPKALFEMRFYLETLKERLISALKRSKTGNDKIISSDGCVCRRYECAMSRCSKSCNRACSVEPQLTRFMCDKVSDALNNSVPIELICNGKANCPNGEDETGCQIELCRPHHLLVLRHKLVDVGRVHQGTALGEALRAWRIKVTATLKIAETNDRPSPPILHDILSDVLHDLVMSYAILEDRRDSNEILQEFLGWSKVVMDTLKSCNA